MASIEVSATKPGAAQSRAVANVHIENDTVRVALPFTPGIVPAKRPASRSALKSNVAFEFERQTQPGSRDGAGAGGRHAAAVGKCHA